MKVNRLQIVTAFEFDPTIALSCGPAIKRLQKEYGGRILSINTPDEAPPSAPRVVLQLSDTVLNITQERFQLIVSPPSQVQSDLLGSIQFVLKRATSFLPILQGFAPKYDWAGVIADCEYVSGKDGLPPANAIFEGATRCNSLGREVASCSLNFGLKENGFFYNYAISSFETLSFEREILPGEHSIVVKRDELPIGEVGINVVLDVNNRGGSDRVGPIEDVTDLTSRLITMQSELPTVTSLEGLF